jgi:hypothetical protein
MLLITWLYIVLVVGYRPTIKEFKRVSIHFTYLLLFVWGFNHLVGVGEYFYILSSNNRPFLKTLSEGVWVLANIVIMVLVMTIKTRLFSPHLFPFKLNFKQNET